MCHKIVDRLQNNLSDVHCISCQVIILLEQKLDLKNIFYWPTKHLCNIDFSLTNIDRKWNIFNAIFDGTSRRAKDKILWNPCELFAGLYRAESRCASSIFFAGNKVLRFITSKNLFLYHLFFILTFLLNSTIYRKWMIGKRCLRHK